MPARPVLSAKVARLRPTRIGLCDAGTRARLGVALSGHTSRTRAGFCILLIAAWIGVGCVLGGRLTAASVQAATGVPRQDRYMAYQAVEDAHGVIAPWYRGLNGQCDFRVRVAAETLKRYPWKLDPIQGPPAPDYVYNGRWKILPDGTIVPQPLGLWGNGDLAQRAAYSIFGWVEYYRYTGDPAAIAHLHLLVDALLANGLTGADHPWPGFIISVPNAGEPYGQADARGMIQLDLAALTGEAILQAYRVTGEPHWLDVVKHWADLLADKRDRTPEGSPWNRYANPEDVFWEDQQTGGVVLLLRLFDDLIRLGYTGREGALLDAREAGLRYVRASLLPNWLGQDTWARHYWDWNHNVQCETISEMAPRYMMRHRDWFPGWRADARNLFSLYIHRACVPVESGGGVYSGAWAFPEGPECCGRSLQYPPMQIGAAFAEYGVRADCEWAREMARRQFILATYDAHETGVVEDGFDGGQVVADTWLQCAHPLPLWYVLEGMAWLPEALGANRENHIMRSSSVVTRVRYDRGRVSFTTFDAPAETTTVLRLAFRPEDVIADGSPLLERSELDEAGYQVRPLSNGDCIVSIRHDGRRQLSVSGDDPQQVVDDATWTWRGAWSTHESTADQQGVVREASAEGSEVLCAFAGHQVRLIGSVGPDGGQAEIYLDGVRQPVGLDCWNPHRLDGHVLWYKNGLDAGEHSLRIVTTGRGNPLSGGRYVRLEAVQYSAAEGDAGFGSGGGPRARQAWIFGYPRREDYVDSRGLSWRPATELVIRGDQKIDPVQAHWHTSPRRLAVAGTADPVLYRHGVSGKDFTAYVTCGPGTYHVRLRFMEHRLLEPEKRAMDVFINGQAVATNLDVAATASGRPATVKLVSPNGTRIFEGLFCAADLVFDGIQPSHGVIAVRFVGRDAGDAIVSAIEVAPGPGGSAAAPMPATAPALGAPPRRK